MNGRLASPRRAPALRARLRRLPRPAPPRRWVLVLAVLGIGLTGAWLWLRDSSLVAVRSVTVQGAAGPQTGAIRSALVSAARSMTTLDVREDRLRVAMAPYPVVKDLQVDSRFPHGLRIRVIEQVPVGAVLAAGRPLAVAADGTLLHDVPVSPLLPVIPLRVPPGGTHLTETDGMAAVAVLAAAPPALLGRITQVTSTGAQGLVAQLRAGPQIRFGDSSRAGLKWRSVTAVLSDPGSAGAAYVDVTDPGRPAAGAGSIGAGSSGAGGSTAAGSTGAGSTSTASSTGAPSTAAGG